MGGGGEHHIVTVFFQCNRFLRTIKEGILILFFLFFLFFSLKLIVEYTESKMKKMKLSPIILPLGDSHGERFDINPPPRLCKCEIIPHRFCSLLSSFNDTSWAFSSARR